MNASPCRGPSTQLHSPMGGPCMATAAARQRVIVMIAVSFLSGSVLVRAVSGTNSAAATPAHGTDRRPTPLSPSGRASDLDARLAAALTPVLRADAGTLAVGVVDAAAGITVTYHGRRS